MIHLYVSVSTPHNSLLGILSKSIRELVNMQSIFFVQPVLQTHVRSCECFECQWMLLSVVMNLDISNSGISQRYVTEFYSQCAPSFLLHSCPHFCSCIEMKHKLSLTLFDINVQNYSGIDAPSNSTHSCQKMFNLMVYCYTYCIIDF